VVKVSTAPAWQRAQVVQTGLTAGVVVVALLYWAQVVFVPVALAVFLTFLLSPLVGLAQRRGLGRIPAVVLVVLLAAAALGGLGWLTTHQVTRLVTELPSYTENIKAKVKYLRDRSHGSVSEGLERMMREVTGEWESQPADPANAPAAPPAGAKLPPAGEPTKVVVKPESTAWFSWLPAALTSSGLGSVLAPVGAVALAMVLTVFMLLKRENLRNRFLRLVGHGRMSATTKAVDDAGRRISRYLVMQLIVNGTYGLAWGLGLLLIGVDYALLWGLLAAVLRYVPYVGAPAAALLPIALSLAMFEGWVQPLLVVGLLIALELVSNNVIEPWLYGMSIGVSEMRQPRPAVISSASGACSGG